MPDGLAPPPPGGLGDYTPRPWETYVLPAQSRLWRLYKRQLHNTNWNTFRSFGPTDSRFDHHLPPKGVQERSILYAAEDWDTCVAEVFQEQRLVDTHKDEPRLVAFTFTSDIRLLDLGGSLANPRGCLDGNQLWQIERPQGLGHKPSTRRSQTFKVSATHPP